MSMTVSDLERRNFFLNMSIPAGQTLAAMAGFIPPPQEAQVMEMKDAYKNWTAIKLSGMNDHLSKSAMWLTNLMRLPFWSDEYAIAMYNTILGGLGSSLMMLREAGMLQFAYDPEHSVGIWDDEIDGHLPATEQKYSYFDEISHLDFEPDLFDLEGTQDD